MPGLPIPTSTQRIDLAVSNGIPAFLDVLRAALTEMQVETAIVASELETRSPSPEMHLALTKLLGDIPMKAIPHEEFKARTAQAKAIARTGQFTPYANVILIAGVVF